MQYPCYKSYQPSRLEWVDEIPCNWDITRLRLISSRYAGGTPSKDNSGYWQDGTIPWLNSGAVNQGTITKPSEYITELGFRESSAKWIPENAIIIALAGQGKTKGTAAYTTIRTTCNQSMGVVVFEKDCPRFMYWWLVSQYKNIRGMASDDARDGLNLEMLGTIPCPLPSMPEQQKIAAFLDYKTQQIDQLIEKKKTLIEKLEEKRIAVITQAVTKGLDKNAKLKPSGVDWLGDVPEHWEVMQFKDRCRVVSGQVDPTAPDFEDLPLVAPDHIEKNSGRIIALESAKEQGAISGKYLFQEGDVLYSKIRPELNKLCIAPGQGLCSADMYAIRTEDGFLSIYLFFMMLSKYYFQYAVLESMRVAMPKINRESLGAFKILVPPVDEQEIIIQCITSELSAVEKSIDVAKRSVSTLEEYRSAIITSAVTGKIDVRKAEIPRELA